MPSPVTVMRLGGYDEQIDDGDWLVAVRAVLNGVGCLLAAVPGDVRVVLLCDGVRRTGRALGVRRTRRSRHARRVRRVRWTGGGGGVGVGGAPPAGLAGR